MEENLSDRNVRMVKIVTIEIEQEDSITECRKPYTLFNHLKLIIQFLITGFFCAAKS